EGAYNELIDIDWNEVYRYTEIQRHKDGNLYLPQLPGGEAFGKRLVRTVKSASPGTLAKAPLFCMKNCPNYFYANVKKVVNSRPLTYLSERYAGFLTQLRPWVLFEIPTADTKDLDVWDLEPYSRELKNSENEYLGQLIKRQKQHPQSSNIQMGDIVLIRGRLEKIRLQWPLTRVIKLIQGKDGLVRTVKLKTKSCPLTRPIQHLFPRPEASENNITNHHSKV
ncbi:integrase catalytic domain-containing protein, partial [Trichonephila clavipes]